MGREEDEEDGGDNGFGREEAKDQRKGGGHVCTMTLQPPPDLNALWGLWGCEEPMSQIVLAEGPQISLCAPYWLVLIEISQLAQYIIWGFIRIGILLCLADTQRNYKIGFCIVICRLTT